MVVNKSIIHPKVSLSCCGKGAVISSTREGVGGERRWAAKLLIKHWENIKRATGKEAFCY